MRRRRIAVAIALAMAAPTVPLRGGAQSSGSAVRIGYLSALSEADDRPNLAALRQGLAERGYVEGRNVTLVARHAGGNLERLPELAAEIVRAKPAVIVAAPTPPLRALQQATRAIPIVMAYVGDPIGDGFVASLARPGGNITGFSSSVSAMAVKRVEFLKAVAPRMSHVALLAPPQSVGTVVTESVGAGRSLGVKVTLMQVRSAEEIDRAFALMPAAHVDGVIVNLALRHHGARIAEAARRARLPTMSSQRDFAEAGGLMSYGPLYADLYRRCADYVDRILKGASPAELPVQQPTKFELAVNLRTAKALGVSVPPSLLTRADALIE